MPVFGFPNFNKPPFAKDGCLKLIYSFSSNLAHATAAMMGDSLSDAA
jgi:hypothetical protein